MKTILHNFVRKNEFSYEIFKEIVEQAVCNTIVISRDTLYFQKNKKKAVMGRTLYFVFMQDVCNKIYGISFFEIGKVFNKNHVSVCAATKLHNNLLETKDLEYTRYFLATKWCIVKLLFYYKQTEAA